MLLDKPAALQYRTFNPLQKDLPEGKSALLLYAFSLTKQIVLGGYVEH